MIDLTDELNILWCRCDDGLIDRMDAFLGDQNVSAATVLASMIKLLASEIAFQQHRVDPEHSAMILGTFLVTLVNANIETETLQ